jgi:hypothetical protein
MMRRGRGDEKQLQEEEHEENYHQLLTFLAGKRKQATDHLTKLHTPAL